MNILQGGEYEWGRCGAAHPGVVFRGGLNVEVDERPVPRSARRVGDVSKDCARATRWTVKQARGPSGAARAGQTHSLPPSTCRSTRLSSAGSYRERD